MFEAAQLAEPPAIIQPLGQAAPASGEPIAIAQRGPVQVSNAFTLALALKTAKPGARIVLAPGTYPKLSLGNLQFGAPVTLVATGATAAGLTLDNVSGLRIVGLAVELGDADPSGRLSVANSRNIRLTELKVRGQPLRQGLVIQRSRDIRVDHCSFDGLKNGVVHSASSDVVIEANTFRRMSADGVTGAGSSRLLIKDNDFSDFAPFAGAHPDAIQIFTKGASASAEDITIVGNRINRGRGGIPQGIFLTDQVGNLPYRRVVIRDNEIIGAMHNGIAVMHAEDVEISGNTVQPIEGMNSRISLFKVTRGRTFNNRYWKLVEEGNQDLAVQDRPSLKPKAAP